VILEHANHRRGRTEAGSSTVELVLAAPVLVVFLLFMVFAGRVVVAMGEVDAAARDAARDASLSRSAQSAQLAARRAAAADLFGNRLVACERVAVDVDTTKFQPSRTATGATAGVVAVSVRCQMRTSDLTLLGLRGSQVVERRATAPVDAFRGVSLGFVNSEGSSAGNSRVVGGDG
jgi:Flp pilus assembly protein TadG